MIFGSARNVSVLLALSCIRTMTGSPSNRYEVIFAKSVSALTGTADMSPLDTFQSK